MAKRKFKSYCLWLKWRTLGWKKEAEAVNLPWPAKNPKQVLENHMAQEFYSINWVRGKNWKILPEGRTPK